MARPRIVVVERSHYPHEVDYEEEIASYERTGYRVVLRRRPGHPEMDYVALEEGIEIPTTREQTLAKGLAEMASNFGKGSFSGSPGYKTMVEFRIAATETLQKAGYVFKENPDGWYLEGKLIIPM